MKKLLLILLLLPFLGLAQQQTVNIGTSANDHTGDPLRTAFGKLNANDTELYANVLASATASGTDTYSATPDPAITSYSNGQKFIIKFTNANTGSSTINLNGLGAKTLKKSVTTDLSSGDILSGEVKVLVYDGTNFQIVGGTGSGAVETVTGDGVDNTDPVNPVIDFSTPRVLTTDGALVQSDHVHTVYLRSGSPQNLTLNTLLVNTYVNLINDGAGDWTILDGTATHTGASTIAAGEFTTVIYTGASSPNVLSPSGSGGDVVGPASAVNNRVVFFDGTTGKLIKDSGLTLSGSNTGDQTTITGNAGTATALQTPRTIGTVTGDATSAGSSFDGTANNTNALTLATVNSNVGSFGSATASPVLTVNGKGLITAVSNTTITPTVGSITGLGTGVGTWLTTPSWTNFSSAITGTAPFWLTTGTTTLTGAAEIAATTTNTVKISVPSIGITPIVGAGIWLQNTASATLGTQQISPSITLEGTAYNNSTLVPNTVQWMVDVLPVLGSPVSSTFRIRSATAGGSFFNALNIGTSTSNNTALNILGTTIYPSTNSDAIVLNAVGGAVSTGLRIAMPGYAITSGSGAYAMVNYTGGWSTSSNTLTGATYRQHFNNPIFNLSGGSSTINLIGYDWSPTITNIAGVSNYMAWRNTSGSMKVNGTTLTANTILDVQGGGTTTGNTARFADSGNTTSNLFKDDGTLTFEKIGAGIQVKTGTNARVVQATLVAGTVTVNNNTITANTVIMPFVHTVGGTVGFLYASARVANTSFTITSVSALDTSVIDVYLIEIIP